MPIPAPNCPPGPQAGSVDAAPGQGVVPGMGVFIIERGKVNALNCPPCSRSLQRLHTALPGILPVPVTPSFKATAAVQLVGVIPPAGVVQNFGFRAASKNGWGVSAF